MCWDSHVPSYILLTMTYTDWFSNIKTTLNSWNKPKRLWCVILFIISRSSLLIFCLGFLHLCSWEKLASNFLFCNVLVRNWYQVILASWNGLGSISSFCSPKVFAFHCFFSKHHSGFFTRPIFYFSFQLSSTSYTVHFSYSMIQF